MIQHLDLVSYDGQTYEVKSARINMTSATTTTIVGAVAGKSIMVIAYQVGPASGATNVTIQDAGATVVEGPFYVSANGGIVNSVPKVSTQVGGAGLAMQVVSSAAVNVTIKIWYIEV